MNDYSEALREQLRSFRSEPPPPPWKQVEIALAGGVHSVGFGIRPGEHDLLLVASWSGRSVIDGPTGERLARDRNESVDDWTGPLGQDCEGIGPLEGQRIPVAGIWGGGLPLITTDNWSIAREVVDWPDERIVLQPPGTDVLVPERRAGCTQLYQTSSDVRAAGFSSTGVTLVIATSSELLLFERLQDGAVGPDRG